MTFHFIIIPCVQFHFRASTIYNVCIRRYYTYKKTRCKTDKNYRYKNSLLHRTNCALCRYYIKKENTILFKKIKLFITEKVKLLVPTVFFTACSRCYWSQSVSQTHPKLFIKSKKKHTKLFLNLFPS